MQPPSSFTAPIRSVDSVEHFTATTDVLICGYGGAGAAAALEAARAGARVTVLELSLIHI